MKIKETKDTKQNKNNTKQSNNKILITSQCDFYYYKIIITIRFYLIMRILSIVCIAFAVAINLIFIDEFHCLN